VVETRRMLAQVQADLVAARRALEVLSVNA